MEIGQIRPPVGGEVEPRLGVEAGVMREYHARTATRPQSKFIHLTEAEFRDGLRRLEHDAQAQPHTHTAIVNERYDLLVLEVS